MLDVRADPRFHQTFTTTLTDLGFTCQTSGEGLQHRWIKGDAQIDILLPDGVGQRSTSRPGAGGGPTLATPGGTQALHRTETVAVTVAGHQGYVRRPNLVRALVMKAAAHSIGTDGRRHRLDFLVLATILAARDFRKDPASAGDRRRLRAMTKAVRKDNTVILRDPRRRGNARPARIGCRAEDFIIVIFFLILFMHVFGLNMSSSGTRTGRGSL